MNIWVSILLFAVGVLLVCKGGDWFVDAASWIAKAAHVPTFIIGATIVSFATTMPEMIVSVMASVEGKNDMAVGNAVGSVTANTALIMACAFVFMTVIIERKKYIKQCILLMASALVLWIGCQTGQLQVWASALLAVLFIAFMAVNVLEGKKAMTASPDARSEEGSDITVNKMTVIRNILLFIVGAAGIVVGSNFLIKGGSAIAEALGVPERVIALTMVAIGTSLPELITTITAIVKKESSLSVGNIVGANIIDLSLILPVCSLVSGSSFTVSAQSISLDMPVCLGVTVLALVPMLIKERAYRWQGILLLVCYAAYVAVTI